MSDIHDWSTAAATNNAQPPDGAPEGMPANSYNNTMREMMAAVAREYYDTNGSLAIANVADAYSLTINRPFTSYFTGLVVSGQTTAANTTTAPSLNVNNIGAVVIRTPNDASISVGAIPANALVTFVYNARLNNGNGAWQLVTSTPAVSAPTTAPYILQAYSASYGLSQARALAVASGELTSADGGAAGNLTLGLAASGVTAQSYTFPGGGSVTFDSKGRCTAATSSSVAAVTALANRDCTNGGADDLSSVSWTSIPSSARLIEVSFADVSLTTTGGLGVVLGDSGGYEETGYQGITREDSGSAATSSPTTYAAVALSQANSAVFHGKISLSSLGGNTWSINITSGSSADTAVYQGNYSKTLSGTLTSVRFDALAGNFDGGKAGGLVFAA